MRCAAARPRGRRGAPWRARGVQADRQHLRRRARQGPDDLGRGHAGEVRVRRRCRGPAVAGIWRAPGPARRGARVPSLPRQLRRARRARSRCRSILRPRRRHGDGSRSRPAREPAVALAAHLRAVRSHRRLPPARRCRVKYVRQFGGGSAEGRAADKALLGGKGANLAEMASLGLPVPPGFTITTEVCRHVMEHGAGKYPAGLDDEVASALRKVEELTKTTFGDASQPLLVSVRSGAPASMPGMMDTILNLGLNDATVAALAQRSGNPRFAWDCYRRFVAMYGEVVMGVVAPSEHDELQFDRILDDI